MVLSSISGMLAWGPQTGVAMSNVIGTGTTLVLLVAAMLAAYLGFERRAFLAAVALFLALWLVLYLAGGITPGVRIAGAG
jgi:hypothetical protein